MRKVLHIKPLKLTCQRVGIRDIEDIYQEERLSVTIVRKAGPHLNLFVLKRGAQTKKGE
uniref:Uncharacterized protein n=1 Tax=viral metagenome TaxID=1070528 RepID=A0A6M3IP07_9ZZZZ